MSHRSASFNQRLLAQMLDITLIFPAFVLLDHFWLYGGYGFWILCGSFYFVCSVLFENSNRKGTPGKTLLSLEVTPINQNTYGLKNILIRQIFKLLSLLPCCLGFFMIYFHPRGQALHDYLTGTVVISKIPPGANW